MRAEVITGIRFARGGRPGGSVINFEQIGLIRERIIPH
jgi:hypothetical protein